jgi:PAS domain S-box-containing protein
VRTIFLSVVVAAGMTVLVWSAVDLMRHPPGNFWLYLLGFTVVAAYLPLRMPGFPISISLADTFTMTAALLFGPAAAAVGVACDALVISYRLTAENRSTARILFNVSAPALSMWVAAVVYRLTLESRSLQLGASAAWPFVLSLALFVATYFVLNSTLIAGAVAVGRKVPWLRVWREQFLPLSIVYGVGAVAAGLLSVAMRPEAGLGASAVTFPLLLLSVPIFGFLLRRLKRRSQAFADRRTYAAALRSTADAVALTNQDGRLVFINPAGERLTGWTSSDALGRPFDEVVRITPMRDDPDPTGGKLDAFLQARDGTTREVERTLDTIRDEDGTVIGTIATLRDISVRRLVEAAREDAFRREQEARMAADRANRTKDEFLATLSHELRTPAAAIDGWIRLLGTGRLDPAQTAEALASVERNARAQTAMLNDLLDVARIVRGALRLNIQRIDIAAVLRDALATVEPAREAKHITVTVTTEGTLVVDADLDRLRQVFWNLLSNAVKFSNPGGWIRIDARRNGDIVLVEVADGGLGIHPTFLPYVFEPFRQADQSATRGHGGLGLGLAIVRYLVEAHGGTIRVASEGVGAGARFEISLPASPRED